VSTSKMRDGIVKRGSKWTFKVELPPDPETGERRQGWHSGHASREEAKAERDEARARLRQERMWRPPVSRWQATSTSG
jgi:Arm domain-containing DNA-binding protein